MIMKESIKASDITSYKQVVDAIDKFCDGMDGLPRYTFGHIVLDDLNLSDGHIEWCLRQDSIHDWFQHALGHLRSLNVDDMSTFDKFTYRDLTGLRDAVIIFLRWLLEIPEEIRD